ncbi:hypothetical protein [Rhodococcus rhodochrous]|uniref:hypothetical protein n=1 Tax=Rhodococcus rhodochrous TaxID=1829 RepID=UPI001D033B72|nr:hypothetical protein [Rhodococcus rhodochrous]
MTRIFDNITPDTALGTHLQKTFEVSERMDAAVGYFNLRGWAAFDELVKKKVADGAAGAVVRILIGMSVTGPQEEALEDLQAEVDGTHEAMPMPMLRGSARRSCSSSCVRS